MLARLFPRCSLGPVLALCALVMLLDHAQAPGQSTTQSKRSSGVIAPVWYNDPPSRGDTLIARGKGKSNDQQVAIDKAVMEARSSLARSIDHRWEVLLEEIEKEGGAHLEWTPAPVTLTGSTPILQKVFRRGKTWTAFILVGLPESSVRIVLLERLRRDVKWYEGVRNTEAVQAAEAAQQ
jgi:hypothetical protein